ncbi:MAG: dihydropteroate synthase [Microlunatus sp.]|nr:dihydropteroate synthase [Microlunatus sp.]MDN5770606.1 dihydropteroate synthase [Microlunatus sp.]MDN5803401.1 dihydropteroate synthase [Microlunatus sp.]
MGVVNVTPDSFSDGGEWLDPDEAITHGLQLLTEGADLVDVGGESTRPGADRPSTEVELARVLPVVAALAAAGAVVSIDTMRAEVAERAIRAGASLVNDVSGGRADPDMLDTVARAGVAYICMHWRGHSADMQSRASYADLVGEVVAELAEQIEAARAAGILGDRLVVDPGFGFAKTGDHNWELLQRLPELESLGLPMLYGLSRKGFLGTLLADRDGIPRPARERDDASLALTTLLAWRRVWAVRVHRVRPHVDAITVVERLRARPG